MEFAYPFKLRKKAGEYIVRFPDIPEALTGAPTRIEALVLARDALIGALGGYIEDKRDIPPLSRPDTPQLIAYLLPLEAAKLALYIAMREHNITNVALATHLSIDENAVRRMLDLDQPTKIEVIAHALRTVFHYHLVTSMEKITAPA